MNKPVNFELAKLLKEKGFDEPCFYTYINGELCEEGFLFNHSIRSHERQEFISAPTIAEVVMWLYEKHGVWIEVLKLLDGTFSPFMQDVLLELSVCKTPTEAYEAGIEYVLKNLI